MSSQDIHKSLPASMEQHGLSPDQDALLVQRSRLLQLPKELQLVIWEYSLAEYDPIAFFTAGSSQFTTRSDDQNSKRFKWYIPPLLQTCHSCRIEGIPVFYTINTFVLQSYPIFSDYQQAHALFQRYRHYLELVIDFGIEYKLPSLNTFLLRGQRRLVANNYTFKFSSDAASSHQRPLTALEASETDGCLCMINSMIKRRRYSTVIEYTDAMIAFLASFAEKMSKNVIRVLRSCEDCGKKMIEQKPRRPTWEDIPPISMPTHESMD